MGGKPFAKMKLAIIRRRYTPYGGAERFIERIAARLSEGGVATTILAEQWDAAEKPAAPMEVLRAASRGWSRAARFRSFQDSVAEILRRHSFDLVQSHERLMGADIYRAGDGVHAAWMQRLLREAGKWRAAWLQRDPYHRVVMETERRMASDKKLHFVANSMLVASELHGLLGIPEDRITVIPNGVDTARFAPPDDAARAEARRKFHLQEDAPVIAFVGSGFARKGAFHLVEAMRLLPDVFLLVCGQDKKRAALEALAAKLRLDNRVKILGAMNDVRPVLHASDIFALPSLYDPSPNAALEALGCGLPVITTDDTGLAREIAMAGAGAVCARDPEDIAQKIKNIITDRPRLAVAAAQARTLALNFDQSRIVTQWLDFYGTQKKHSKEVLEKSRQAEQAKPFMQRAGSVDGPKDLSRRKGFSRS